MTDAEQVLQLVVFASTWLVLLALIAVAVADLILAILEAPSIGRRVQRWARHYPAFAVALIFVFGALLGHFFSQP